MNDIITNNYHLMHGDCLVRMKEIPDNSIDCIVVDLPYGTTACSWDTIINFDVMWTQIKRITKPQAPIIMFASQPFTSALIMSNPEWFKYCWVWKKNRATGHVHAKNKPMKLHEDVCVFSSGTTVHASQSKTRMPYFPQGMEALPEGTKRRTRNDSGDDSVMSARKSHRETIATHTGYPVSIIEYAIEMNDKRFHPTQKPVDMLEYLIKTYSNEGDTILDFTMGSGSTGVAAINTKRKFIGIELTEQYFPIASSRIAEAKPNEVIINDDAPIDEPSSQLDPLESLLEF